MSFYELCCIFFIYAFFGWCIEVAYAAVDRGVFVNRGFLNGPYCPIYGFGVSIVTLLLTPLRDNLLILFLGSFLLTSLLEFITGFLLEKLFHTKWWDYSDKPFNIKGYVCLKFSVYWGMACTFVMDIIQPMIMKFIHHFPNTVGVVLIVFFSVVFVGDSVYTVLTILKLNRHLRKLDEMAQHIHAISDELGEKIYDEVTQVMEKSEELQLSKEEISKRKEQFLDDLEIKIQALEDKKRDEWEEKIQTLGDSWAEKKQALADKTRDSWEETKQALEDRTRERQEEKKQERDALLAKYQELLSKKSVGGNRILRAFPGMKSNDRNEVLQKYKDYIFRKKK